MSEIIGDAENAELPVGFGRDCHLQHLIIQRLQALHATPEPRPARSTGHKPSSQSPVA